MSEELPDFMLETGPPTLARAPKELVRLEIYREKPAEIPYSKGEHAARVPVVHVESHEDHVLRTDDR